MASSAEASGKVLYGEETRKALENFEISELKVPRTFIWALGTLKGACAEANTELNLLKPDLGRLIAQAAKQVADGEYDDQFPLDIFQTGSGTSTNMNCNEVIAALVNQQPNKNILAHPNDHINHGQSSNDVIPSCIHISAAFLISDSLLPTLQTLRDELHQSAQQHGESIKTGRTHLMDAMPMSFGQELTGWHAQIDFAYQQFTSALPMLAELAIGGTAIGTGVNTHPQFAAKVTSRLTQKTGMTFKPANNHFRAISTQDVAVHVSSLLKNTAITLSKITDDIRWYSSGPLNGLNEIHLDEVQKGSSIMPGKVNPVIPESILMACTQVIGNDTTISLAGKSGNFQLNTMLPLIAHNLIQSIQLLTSSSLALATKVISRMHLNKPHIEQQIARNPILATALNSLIGYDKSAEIAKKAYQEDRTVIDVAKELTGFNEHDLREYLDVRKLIGK